MMSKRLKDVRNEVKSSDIDDSEYQISNYGYGKDSIKILHVVRNGPVHSIKELEVGTKLKLISKKDYLFGNYFTSPIILH